MASNPVIAKLLQNLGGGGVSGPQGQPTDEGGMGASQMASELHGADPTQLLRTMQAIKSQLFEAFVAVNKVGDAHSSGDPIAKLSQAVGPSPIEGIKKNLSQAKDQASQVFTQSAMRLPNISGQLGKTMVSIDKAVALSDEATKDPRHIVKLTAAIQGAFTQIDRAIKEAQQAAATQSVVRSPVGFSMAGGTGSPSGGPGVGGF